MGPLANQRSSRWGVAVWQKSRTLSSDTHGAFPVPGIRNDTGWLELQADCLARPRRNSSLNEPVNWKSCLCWPCVFGTELCFLVPLSPNVKNTCFYVSVKHHIFWSTCPSRTAETLIQNLLTAYKPHLLLLMATVSSTWETQYLSKREWGRRLD